MLEKTDWIPRLELVSRDKCWEKTRVKGENGMVERSGVAPTLAKVSAKSLPGKEA